MLAALLRLVAPSAPVLVLCFAPDASTSLLDPRTVAKRLGLTETERVVSVRNVPESTNTGVAEGFEWLAEVMQ
jgi:hypothetical protein